MNIADQTEQGLIETILSIYTPDKKAALEISKHIAEKLTQRRIIIRTRRMAHETLKEKYAEVS
jgi:hypothetical protein